MGGQKIVLAAGAWLLVLVVAGRLGAIDAASPVDVRAAAQKAAQNAAQRVMIDPETGARLLLDAPVVSTRALRRAAPRPSIQDRVVDIPGGGERIDLGPADWPHLHARIDARGRVKLYHGGGGDE